MVRLRSASPYAPCEPTGNRLPPMISWGGAQHVVESADQCNLNPAGDQCSHQPGASEAMPGCDADRRRALWYRDGLCWGRPEAFFNASVVQPPNPLSLD
jgi:hypothetical protein